MTEYKLANGAVLTGEQFEAEREAGTQEGRLEGQDFTGLVTDEMVQAWCEAYEAGTIPEGYVEASPVMQGHPEH